LVARREKTRESLITFELLGFILGGWRILVVFKGATPEGQDRSKAGPFSLESRAESDESNVESTGR